MSKQRCVRPQRSISISASFMCTKKDNIVCVIYVSENQLLILFVKWLAKCNFLPQYDGNVHLCCGMVSNNNSEGSKNSREVEGARFKLMVELFLWWILILFLNSWEIPFWLLFLHPFTELSGFTLHAFIIIKIASILALN